MSYFLSFVSGSFLQIAKRAPIPLRQHIDTSRPEQKHPVV